MSEAGHYTNVKATYASISNRNTLGVFPFLFNLMLGSTIGGINDPIAMYFGNDCYCATLACV